MGIITPIKRVMLNISLDIASKASWLVVNAPKVVSVLKSVIDFNHHHPPNNECVLKNSGFGRWPFSCCSARAPHVLPPINTSLQSVCTPLLVEAWGLIRPGRLDSSAFRDFCPFKQSRICLCFHGASHYGILLLSTLLGSILGTTGPIQFPFGPRCYFVFASAFNEASSRPKLLATN